MRRSLREQLNQLTESKLLGVDFHDFLQKHQLLNEAELGLELGLTQREIQALKNRLERG